MKLNEGRFTNPMYVLNMRFRNPAALKVCADFSPCLCATTSSPSKKNQGFKQIKLCFVYLLSLILQIINLTNQTNNLVA